MKIIAPIIAILTAGISASTLFAQDPKPIEGAQTDPFSERTMIDTTLITKSKPQPQAYIGIVTAPVPAELTAQLGLPEGFGLLVQDVLPDSPAKAAGLAKYDVLKTFNDQQLVNPDQLSALVRSAGKDKEINLTLMRKGQEQRVTVKVGERSVAEHPDAYLAPEPIQTLRGIRMIAEDEKEKAEAAADKVKKAAEDMHWKIISKSGQLSDDPSVLGKAFVNDKEVMLIRKDGDTRVDMHEAHVVTKDENGTIELGSENGHRKLTVKDAKDNVIFSGPVDTEEERHALPDDVRKKLDKVKMMLDRDVAYRVSKDGSVSTSSASSSSSGTTAVTVTPRGNTFFYHSDDGKVAPKSQ
jgi:hypothetical protein